LVTLHWLLTIAAVFTAIAAWAKTRRLARRLERLAESYWELRYEHGQLRARISRAGLDEAPPSEPASPAGTTAFVPLSSLKR
jgi:HAMP domain-containing protein